MKRSAFITYVLGLVGIARADELCWKPPIPPPCKPANGGCPVCGAINKPYVEVSGTYSINPKTPNSVILSRCSRCSCAFWMEPE